MIKLPKMSELSLGANKLTAIVGAIALVLVMVVGAGVSSFSKRISASNHDTQLDSNHRTAERLAREFGAVLEPQWLKIRAIAKKPVVVAALTAPKLKRDKVAAVEQQSIPGAVLLRLLPPGDDHIDLNSKPPLTFASSDMLHRAGASEKPVDVELHFSGTENEHLVMIQRVPLSGTIVGFLHLSLQSDIVRNALDGITLPAGHVEVRQPVPSGPPVIIAKRGEPTTSKMPSSIAVIGGTKWVVGYSSPASNGSSGVPFAAILGMLAVLAALGAAIVALLRRRVDRSSIASEVTYQGAIKAILEGEHPGLGKLLPSEIGATPVALAPVSGGLGSDNIATISAKGASFGALVSPEDIIDLSNEASGIEIVEESDAVPLDPSIFRRHDIRGVVGDTLTVDGIYQIGRALGSEALARGQQTVVTARDGRNSSQELRDALIEGLRASGRDVLDIGLTPTPVLYFATHYLDSHSGVMITGSHNPPEYNGLKIVLDGESLSGEAIQAIRTRIEQGDFVSGEGSLQSTEIIPDYIRRISEEIPVTLGNALKVVVDCGHSVPGIAAPHILRAIGHDVIELHCEIDGNFPNHDPDPSRVENLQDLIEMVQEEGADLGLAFDGDGDRLGVVDKNGNIIWPDRQMIMYSRDVLSRNPGAKIIYDVKCSRFLADDIRAHGGEPIMAPTGHSLIKSKMQETGALLAGEMSGHIFFKERWYGFDDALYAAARLLEILVNIEEEPADVFDALPGGVATPELHIEMSEHEHLEFMQQVVDAAVFADGEICTIDGLRVDFADRWGLIRASNTTPYLVLRFEGVDESALDKVKSQFRDLLLNLDDKLDLPF
jgi:phosphomannomutase/phosphoglucomutase